MQHIDEIRIENPNRLLLNSERTIIIRPKNRIQIIVGTNGSGKSFLLSQINLMPPQPKFYNKNGVREISGRHQGNTYVLRSELNPTAHYFYKNGINLNDGRTATVQRELIYQEFGITQFIHELLSGELPFSTLSVDKRREAFTLMSKTDYDYAFWMHKQLKTLTRDLQGAYKLAQQKLTSAEGVNVNLDEIATLKDLIAKEENNLAFVEPYKTPLPVDSTYALEQTQNRIVQEAQTKDGLLDEALKVLEKHKLSEDTEHLETSSENIKSELAKVDGALSVVKNQLGNVSLQLSKIENQDPETLKELQNRQNHLEVKIQEIKNTIKTGLVFANPLQAYNAAVALLSDFNVLVEVPVYEELYSTLNFQRLEGELEDTKQTLGNTLNKLNQYREELKHLLAVKTQTNVTCPNCQHQFNTEYSEERVSFLNQELESLTVLENQLSLKKTETLETLSKIRTYHEQYRVFREALFKQHSLAEYWASVDYKELYKTRPQYLNTLLTRLINDLDNLTMLQPLISEYERNLSLLNQGDQSELLSDLQSRHHKLSEDLEMYLQTRTVLLTRLNHVTKNIQRVRNVKSLKDDLDRLKSQYDTNHETLLEYDFAVAVNDIIGQCRIRLGNYSQRLLTLTGQRDHVETLKKEVDGLSLQIEAGKRLVKEISPSEGLIAETLYNVLKTFISQMNQGIRRIATYDLSIGLSKSEELDYMFPVSVKGQSPSDDVKQTSRGQEEIINLVFQRVFAAFLGLKSYRMSLDEFGASFDERHKSKVTDIIKLLIDDEVDTQLFLVSHDPQIYNALPNADIFVLHPDNVVLPDRAYNEHVEMY